MSTAHSNLAKAFRAAYTGSVADEAALEALLTDAIAAARAQWPRVLVEPDAFVRYLAQRVPKGEASKQLEGLCAADVYLAQACVLGQRAALAALDRSVMSAVEEGVARFDRSGTLADEVKQLLRERLLVPQEGQPPKLATYAGIGPLRAWIRAAGYRLAVDLKRKPQGVAIDDVALSERVAAGGDPELQFMKAAHRKEFRQAFSAALAGLEARERNLLRLYVVERQTLEKIASAYSADISTVSRWIQKARKGLLEGTRRALKKRLALSGSALDSFMRIADSQLDVSIVRLLGKD